MKRPGWTRFLVVVGIIIPLYVLIQIANVIPSNENNHAAINEQNAVVEQHPEAPYGEFCETRPRGEKQPWNMLKKVISFSMFLTDDHRKGQGEEIPEWLLGGVEANIRMAKLFYPEWIVRVYVLNLSDQQIEDVLLKLGDLEVVKCHDDSPLNNQQIDSGRKMFNRFLVVDDPTVEYSMIRDLDSRPSIRELLAVNEWIASGLGFHTMRDHPYHEIAVLGGMWGAKRGAINMTATVKRALQDQQNNSIPGSDRGDDQKFLTMYVWPIVKSTSIDHDSQPARCQKYGAKVCRLYPLTSRNDENIFVGQAFKEGTRDTHYECRVDCKHSSEDWYTDMSTSNNF